jgi:hypothetical protein
MARFSLNDWSSPEKLARFNCYNYATDFQESEYLQPGWTANRLPVDFTPTELDELVRIDGLIRVDENEAMRNDGHYLALYCIPKEDFHFFKKDEDGFWSQKIGQKHVTRFDDLSNVISNPRTCATEYHILVGWYKFDGFRTPIP